MPDFGIVEGIAALMAAFGGEAAAGGAALGAGELAAGAGLGAGELAAGAGLGGAAATGAGELGVLGTADAFLGAGGFDALAGGAGAGTGASALGTAGAFLGAGDASLLGGGAALAGGLGEGALGAGAGTSGANVAAEAAAGSGLAGGTGAIAGADTPIAALLGATPTAGFGTTGIGSNVLNANASASPFDVGTKPVTGLGSGGQPAGTGASAVSAPGGVSAVADPTAASSVGGGAAQGTTEAAAKSGGSISDLLGKTGAGAIKSLTDNPLGVGLGAAGLGYNILQGQKQSENLKALQADASKATKNSDSLVSQGQALQQYLTTGKLPDAYEQQVNNAINDAKTRAISNAAAQGQPTDPVKNTALAQTLAGIDNQRSGMVSQIAERLASSGATLINAGQSAAGLSGQLYTALVKNDNEQARNTGTAIANLAAALNGRTQAKIGDTNISLSKAG